MTVSEWESNINYSIGTIVMFENQFFKCLQNHISNQLYNPKLCQHILWTNNSYALKSDIPIVTWRPDTYYFKDSVVEFYGTIYTCMVSHLSIQFHSPLFTIGSLWNYFEESLNH